MLTMTAALTDTIKILHTQERKHRDIPIKGEYVLYL